MTKILFVCLGNICRSPMAEMVLQHMAEKAGLGNRLQVESAATSRDELGNPVYPPARQVMEAHGVPVKDRRARQITREDYDRFDYIIGMDRANLRDMLRIFGGDPEGKLSLLLDWTHRPGDVADPWFTRDFRAAWRDVEEGCTALLEKICS